MSDAHQSHRQTATSRLRIEFGDAVDERQIAAVVEETFSARAAARVQQYVPIFAEREARQRLRDLARTTG